MRSSKSRSRSKSNRPRSIGNIINRVFDSSGPEGKVRGTPQQIIEKYQFLARDAQLSNDRVAAENFMQHAEHYTRMLAEAQRELAADQDQRRPQDYAPNGQNGQNGNGGGQPNGQSYQPSGGQNQSRDGQGSGQNRDQQNRDQQNRDQQSRDGQNRDGQNREQQNRDGQSRDQQSRDGQNREQQSRDGQNRDGQNRDGQNRRTGTATATTGRIAASRVAMRGRIIARIRAMSSPTSLRRGRAR